MRGELILRRKLYRKEKSFLVGGEERNRQHLSSNDER